MEETWKPEQEAEAAPPHQAPGGLKAGRPGGKQRLLRGGGAPVPSEIKDLSPWRLLVAWASLSPKSSRMETEPIGRLTGWCGSAGVGVGVGFFMGFFYYALDL